MTENAITERDVSEWWRVHRHADALVHGIDLPQLSGLVRGGWSGSAP